MNPSDIAEAPAALPDSSRARVWVMLIVFIVLAFLAAAGGAAFPPGEWYAGLRKPSWNPPSWLFGPVWTTLYFMIGTSAWLAWRRSSVWGAPSDLACDNARKDPPRARRAMTLWAAQLVLNAAWTPIFFGAKMPDIALIVILMLAVSIWATIRTFARLSGPAAALLVPYLAWVSFATVLNATLWWMNR